MKQPRQPQPPKPKMKLNEKMANPKGHPTGADKAPKGKPHKETKEAKKKK